MRRIVAPALAVWLAACGGASAPEPETPAAKPETRVELARTEPAPEPTAEKKGPPPAAPPKVTGAAPPQAEEETRTMSASQCKTLESIVGGLVHKEQLSKIDPRLAPDVKQKAQNAAVDAAKSVSESFRDTCMSDLVGKPIRRDVLDCMLKAKEFAAFEGCRKL
jgi:type IV secretory pathway VirB10-like protein